MNLTEEVKKEIIKELKSNGLSESLLSKVEEAMEAKKLGYKQIIKEYLENTTKQVKQPGIAMQNANPVNSQSINSFQDRMSKNSEIITLQVIQKLHEAEQLGYQKYFAGEYDTSVFQQNLGIEDHFPTLSLPIAS
jgi:alanine racemase